MTTKRLITLLIVLAFLGAAMYALYNMACGFQRLLAREAQTTAQRADQ